mgnify:CR=1 FL=1
MTALNLIRHNFKNYYFKEKRMRLKRERRELMTMMMVNTICRTSWSQRDGEIRLISTMFIKEDQLGHYNQANLI